MESYLSGRGFDPQETAVRRRRRVHHLGHQKRQGGQGWRHVDHQGRPLSRSGARL